MPKAKSEASPQERPETLNFEEDLAALEEHIRVLEQGELPLEQALERFEAGTTLLQRCETALKTAEQRVEVLMSKAGESETQPFDAKDPSREL